MREVFVCITILIFLWGASHNYVRKHAPTQYVDIPYLAFTYAEENYCKNNDGVKALVVYTEGVINTVLCENGAVFDVEKPYSELYKEE